MKASETTAMPTRKELVNVIIDNTEHVIWDEETLADAILALFSRSPVKDAAPAPVLTEEERDALRWIEKAHNHFEDDDNVRRCWILSKLFKRLTKQAPQPEENVQ